VPEIASGNPNSTAKASYSRIFDRFFRTLQSEGKITYFPAYEALCDTSVFCKFRDASGLYYWVGGHMTRHGAAVVISKLLERMPLLVTKTLGRGEVSPIVTVHTSRS